MKRWGTVVLVGSVALLAQVQVQSQTLRDPTVAPAGATSAGATDGEVTAGDLPLRLNGSNVVVRNGKPMLVVGTRLVSPGQTVESYRLERITETEIWLRDDSGLTKVPRFAGVQRQAAVAQCPPPKATEQPKKSVKKSTPSPRTKARPPVPKTGAGALRPTRENNPHDC
ncbi:MAG: hypothetical protein E6Q78_14960 [Rhodoferax sp.]|nr:MAG: hypothetical protein E6Q78_14960 [Rhodoferax sp.]